MRHGDEREAHGSNRLPQEARSTTPKDEWTVTLWPHGEPLPPGASHVEGGTVTDHHRFYTSLVVLDDTPLDRFELRRRRQVMGLSLKRLAHKIDVPLSTIHAWECGDRNPSPENRLKWESFFE